MLLLTKYWIAPRAQRFLRWDEDGMSISARYLATARRLTSMPRAESVRRSASSESGAAGSSARMRLCSRCLTAWDETAASGRIAVVKKLRTGMILPWN